jgi:ATP-dependent Lhr-like helicase
MGVDAPAFDTPLDQVLARFHPAAATWFCEQFHEATTVQRRGWDAISQGGNVLLGAPTGSGKTLAAFLYGISQLASEPLPENEARLRIVYISPLRALNYDIERNLQAPLAGIARVAERLGEPIPDLRVGVRTGDTPQSERQRQKRNPPDILITTPESLYVMLSSTTRELFTGVNVVIVDEIHALASSKRGTHLALTLERLEEQLGPDTTFQRIGLSATQRPIERIARFLGGPRPVDIVETPSDKVYDVRVEVPVEDMTVVGVPIAQDLSDLDTPTSNADSYSIWGALHEQLLDHVEQHRSTIIFTNSRRLSERIASALNELAERRAAIRARETGDEPEHEHEGIGVVARAHHGSISRETRREMEEQLKAGQLPAIVATSSLELGIDMGAVDLVLHVESPRTVASGIQRIGRAGHNVGDISVARIFPKHRRDLLECAAVTRAIVHGDIEPVHIPELCLDVLAQQLVAFGIERDVPVDSAFDLALRADPYRDLTREQFDNLLGMLAGYFPGGDLADLKARVVWDREAGTYTTRSDAARVAVTNGGTIPDRGLYGVFAVGGKSSRIGELDEEMVHETRLGDVIVLGATTWRVEEITRDRVLVSPVPGAIGKMPFWHGEGLGRSVQLGRAVGELTRTVASADHSDAELVDEERDRAILQTLGDDYLMEATAAVNLVQYVREQRRIAGDVPSDSCVVVERFRDELGDWRVCILTPFGKSVHAPWAMAVEAKLGEEYNLDTTAMWSDDGIALRLPDMEAPPPVTAFVPDPDDIEELVLGELDGSALFASRFREIATRALILPLASFRQRSPLWLQRLKAHDVLQVASQHSRFPMILETYRECMRDVFELSELRSLLTRLRDGRVRLVDVETRSASPFASSLLFDYTADLLYDDDRPSAERRAQALSLDQALLRELLGTDDIRDLLEPDAIEDVGSELQRTHEKRRARNADQLHDVLRELGDLSRDELAQRTNPDVLDCIDELLESRRAVEVRIAGEPRIVAVEDVGTYTAALGVQPPPGTPQVFLDEPEGALCALVTRWARTHTPFVTSTLAHRWGLAIDPVERELQALCDRSEVLRGGFLPAGAEPEWCDPDVLRRLRRRTLAMLRRQIEPIEQEQLARFLLGWHGMTRPSPGGPQAVQRALVQLEGVRASAHAWEHDLLASRMATWNPRWLEELVQTGDIYWMGRGRKHGVIEVELFARDDFSLLAPQPEPLPEHPNVQEIHDILAASGASFLRDIADTANLTVTETLQALWRLAEAGWCTNDSWATLRAGEHRVAKHAAAQRTSRRATRASMRRSLRRNTLHHDRIDTRLGGRWALLPQLRASANEHEQALAEALLDCYGVVTRAAVASRDIPGGYASVYRHLAVLEELGGVRRGYFVEGLGGAQFAVPEAVDRLRALRDAPTGDHEVLVLRANDPVQPYGTILPWPQREDWPAPKRTATGYVVLRGGELIAHVAPSSRRVNLYVEDQLETVATALGSLVESGRVKRLAIEQLNGGNLSGEHMKAFAAPGFVQTPRGVQISTSLARTPARPPARTPATDRPASYARPSHGRDLRRGRSGWSGPDA